MWLIRIAIFIASLAVLTTVIEGHGRVIDPPHRGNAWRSGFNTPRNYDDMSNFCGGKNIMHNKNGGRCGLCGDNYADKPPRANENGGVYGTGTIVETYEAGTVIEIGVELTRAHKGYFTFSICSLDHQSESEECFDENKLPVLNGGNPQQPYRFTAITAKDFVVYRIQLALPHDLRCKHCVLRWHYRAGNDWEPYEGAVGQETFRTCSDIQIV